MFRPARLDLHTARMPAKRSSDIKPETVHIGFQCPWRVEIAPLRTAQSSNNLGPDIRRSERDRNRTARAPEFDLHAAAPAPHSAAAAAASGYTLSTKLKWLT